MESGRDLFCKNHRKGVSIYSGKYLLGLEIPFGRNSITPGWIKIKHNKNLHFENNFYLAAS
jgi:hypothetical protein